MSSIILAKSCKLPKNFRWIYASFLWKVFYNKGFLSTLLRSQLKQNTALLSTDRASMCPSVTGITSHISHIYKGINAMLIIRGPIKPCIFWIKIILAIFLAKTRPDKTIFSALTNLTINFDFKLFTLSCFFYLATNFAPLLKSLKSKSRLETKILEEYSVYIFYPMSLKN